MNTTVDSYIHPTAIVSEGAKIGADVKIGPYTTIGPHVEIGDGTVVGSHCVLEGHLKIGRNNRFFQFASVGAEPQDYSYKGEPTRVEIGDGNVFREFVTVNCGTLKEQGLTKIGNNSLFMAYVHFGHDTIVGDHCTIANSTNIAGHVRIADRVIIGGGTQVSQFTRLGRGAYVGGASAIDRDIPSFCTAVGNRVKLKGINIIGMKRLGIGRQEISDCVEFLRAMESSLLSPKAFVENSELMEPFQGKNDVIEEIIDQVLSSQVGIAPFIS